MNTFGGTALQSGAETEQQPLPRTGLETGATQDLKAKT